MARKTSCALMSTSVAPCSSRKRPSARNTSPCSPICGMCAPDPEMRMVHRVPLAWPFHRHLKHNFEEESSMTAVRVVVQFTADSKEIADQQVQALADRAKSVQSEP